MNTNERKLTGTKLLVIIALAIIANAAFVINTIHPVAASTHPQGGENPDPTCTLSPTDADFASNPQCAPAAGDGTKQARD